MILIVLLVPDSQSLVFNSDLVFQLDQDLTLIVDVLNMY